MRGGESQRLGRAHVKWDVFFHQGAAEGIFELLGPPEFGGLSRPIAEGTVQLSFHAERIDQRAVHVEGEDGLGGSFGHAASPLSRDARCDVSSRSRRPILPSWAREKRVFPASRTARRESRYVYVGSEKAFTTEDTEDHGEKHRVGHLVKFLCGSLCPLW